MVKRNIFLLALIVVAVQVYSQNRTDVSLFMKEDPLHQLSEVYSETGDMYQTLGHHGPAVENEYLAIRLYFNWKAAVDIYSKSRAGLELKKAAWYPTPEQQSDGWGADYYKVGETVGLGGIRLWDGGKVIPLDPVSGRYARVQKEGSVSFLEMISEGVPYRGRDVDILVRITVYTGKRNAKVEAFALSDEKVQFVTGINYHQGQEIILRDQFMLTWGLHPEDVASEQVEIGAAILFNPEDFVEKRDDGSQKLLISHPTKQLECWISSASSKEQELKSLEKFLSHLESW